MTQTPDPDILNLVPAKNPDYEFDDEYLINIMNPQDTLFVNGPAAMIWIQCDGATNVASMVEELKACYPEDHEVITADAIGALMMLAERGTITLG